MAKNGHTRFRVFLLVLAGLLSVSAAGYGLFHWQGKRRVVRGLQGVADILPAVEAIDCSRVSIAFPGEPIRLEDLSIRLAGTDVPVFIESAVIHSMDRSRAVPRWMHLDIRGARIRPRDHFPPLFGVTPSGSVGENIECRFSADYRRPGEEPDIEIRRLLVGAGRVGEIELTGRFDNLDLGRLFSLPFQPAEAVAAVAAARIRHASLFYRDGGLVRGMVTEASVRQGLSPERIARRFTSRIRVRAEGPRQGKVAQILAPVERFLADPRQIQLQIRPPKPVSIGALFWVRDPEQLIEMLGLRIEDRN